VSRVRLIWDVAYVLAGAAIAAAIAWPIYESPRVILIAAVGAGVGSGLVLLGRRLGWRFWRVALLAVAAFVVLVVPLAIPSGLAAPDRFLRALRDGVFGIVLGWKQLLTLSLPLGDYQAVLVPLLVVMLFGTVIALSIVVRSARWAAAAVPVVIAMAVFGIAFGSSDTGAPLSVGEFRLPAPREVLLGILLVVVSLAWLVGRTRFARIESLRIAQASTAGVRQGPQSFWRAARRRILAAILVVAALVGGLAIAPVAAALSPRQALRDRIDPLVVLRDQPSPLAGYRSSFAGDAYDGELFTVAGDTGSFDRLRIATLDSYDGQVFEVGAGTQFSRLPRTSPAAGSSELTVTIGDSFTGPWVPVPTGLTAAPTFEGSRADLLADGFYIGESDATAIDTALSGDATYGLRAGDTYRVYGMPAEPGDALASARGGDSLIPVDAYPALADWVDLQEVPRTGGGLVELVGRLTERGYLSHSLTDGGGAQQWISDLSARAPYTFQSSYAGHSTARVEELFTDLLDQQTRAGESAADELLVAAIGDDEQFATAAALLGRYFGFDSRVVVGVRLADGGDSPIEPCDDGTCTGANLTAWAEVLTPTGEWVPLDSSPQFSVAPTTIAVGEQLPENPTVPDQTATEVVTPPAAQRDDSDGADAPPPTLPGWLETLLPILGKVGMGSLGVLLLLLPAGVLLFAKLFRRRARRDAPVPEVSIVGAWDELVDLYVDNGVEVEKNRTRASVAKEIARPAAVALAATVDLAVFAENPPGRAASDYAWTLVDDERQVLKRASTRAERIRAAVSPASFLRYLDPGLLLRAGLAVFRRREPV